MLCNMKKFISFIRNHYLEIYKGFLFLLTIILLVSSFPHKGKFKYEFQKGKLWMHKDLIAPFDFAILKSNEEIEKEKKVILKDHKPYFKYNQKLYIQKRNELYKNFEKNWQSKYSKEITSPELKEINKEVCFSIFDTLLTRGIIELNPVIENKAKDYSIKVLRNNVAVKKELSQLFTIHSADKYIRSELKKHSEADIKLLLPLLENSIIQNVNFDAETTQKEKKSLLSKISLTRGMVKKGELIISRDELVTNKKYKILKSLKNEYETQLGSSSNYYLILIGQIILVSISVAVFILYLSFFRKDIFESNKKLLLILIIILLMVFLTSITIKYNENLLYIVPICLVPIIIRSFFDTRLALFVTIITIIIIGFLVPNSFEFVFLQLIAGIITIVSIVKLQKRSQFFLTSILIFATYSIIYLGISLIQEGSFKEVNPVNFALFAGNALLTLFSYPLIYVFEKLFGFVTDVTLMELSDTNSKLLRMLAMKAPGTFQHSMQVSNLAEEAIHNIGGNALLVRTGALYHDIGKMDMPMYFIENQMGGINPHDELTYEESAKIIISHVIKGIEKAKKYKIQEQIIDFIRTHHGTTKVDYFYTLQKRNFPDEPIDESVFTYHGPIPFSKETAVLMMADSVEAASRSLKLPDEDKIDKLVENIINKQVAMNQFVNSNITFRDITKIKNIFKKKLLNIYHIRIEYPE